MSIKLNVIDLEKSEYTGGNLRSARVVAMTRFPRSLSKLHGRMELHQKGLPR